jgi:hypothetical protein
MQQNLINREAGGVNYMTVEYALSSCPDVFSPGRPEDPGSDPE